MIAAVMASGARLRCGASAEGADVTKWPLVLL